jgi:phage terminase large subunit GpA-like protein
MSDRETTIKKRRMRSVDRTFARSFANYTPPADLTVSEWAEAHRVLSRENSAESGPWRNARTPYLVEIMDAFTDPKVEKISLVASSQVGKSELELNIIGYIIDQDPGSILYIQPTVDDAKKFSRLRIAPMIRDSLTLRQKVADIKSRDSGNTMLQKSFPGGMLTIVGSNSASGLASTPAKYVLGDERDRWALSAGTEGDPWALAEARTTTFYNSKMVDVSTPTDKETSPIAKSFNEGTRERWCHKCPHCGEYSNIVFDNIKFDFETIGSGRKKDYVINSVSWSCPECGCLSSEDEMRRQPAEWIAENPEAYDKGHRSFWLNAFSSPWQAWSKVVYSFLIARKDPQRLKVVYNTMLGELWQDRGDLEDEDTLLSRREDYGTREDGTPIELPDGVLVLTCGVDTQDAFFSYEVVGHGFYGETFGIKKGVIMGDPNDDDTWFRLDDVLDRVYRFKDGRGLTISMTCIDSGGHKTQSVYKHCRDRLSKRVFAIKGQGGDGIPFTKPPSKVKIVVNGKAIGQTYLYVLGVDAGKASIMSSLKVEEPGPKYCHFPKGEERGYDFNFFNELLSERLVQKTERGRTRWAWERIPGIQHNEALDARNYAMAALRILDPNMDAVAARLRQMRNGETSNPVVSVSRKRKRGAIRRKDRMDEW